MALFKIIKKNFKLLIRSKSSALIIIFGPLLVIFLVGIAFDNMDRYNINIGAYSSSYSDLSESYISNLRQDDFSVEKVSSEDECIERIKMGSLHSCIIFPPDLVIESGTSQELIFYVDQSKMNLMWMVLDSLSSNIGERSSEVSRDITSNLLKKVSEAQSAISATKSHTDNIKNQNLEIDAGLNTLSSGVSNFDSSSNELRLYILERVVGAESVIADLRNHINNSNATDSQKNVLSTRAASVNTYLYNIKNKLNDNPDSDWSKMLSSVDSLDSQIISLKSLISDSNSKVDNLVSVLDQISFNLGNIEIKDADTIANPVITTVRPVVQEESYLNYMFPSLIVLVVMFISILLSTTLVMMEKHSPAYFRNFITPTKTLTFILASYFTSVMLVFLQIAIILLISFYFFQARIVDSLYVLIPSLLLITSLFSFIGMLIGYLFNSEETSTLAAISIGSVFLFLSNVILPLESMPLSVREFARFNPFILSESILRRAIFFNADFSALSYELKLLLLYSFVLLVLIWIVQKVVRKHLFHKLIHFKHRRAKN